MQNTRNIKRAVFFLAAVLFAGISFAQSDTANAKDELAAKLDSVQTVNFNLQKQNALLKKQVAADEQKIKILNAQSEKALTDQAAEKKADAPKPFDPGFIDPKADKYAVTDQKNIETFFGIMRFSTADVYTATDPLALYRHNPLLGQVKSITVYSYRFGGGYSAHAKVVIVTEKGSFLERLYNTKADLTALQVNEDTRKANVKFSESYAKEAVGK